MMPQGGTPAVLLAAALSAGCASAPRFHVTALVRVEGEGDRAWENAREAARAVALRRNLSRLYREVKHYRFAMLDAEDPIGALRDAIAARREGRGVVRVRFYGDSRWELRRLCRALLALWESEGIVGILRTSGLARRRPRPPPVPADELEVARRRARLEEDERRLFQDKQRLLGEQVEVGRRWQQAEALAQERERALLASRKALAVQQAELERVRAALRLPEAVRAESFRDPDVGRLRREVEESEGALRKAGGQAEVRRQIEAVLARKRRALSLAIGRIEREAESRVVEARERVSQAERALAEAHRAREALQRHRAKIAAALVAVDRQAAGVRQSLVALKENVPMPARPRPVERDVRVYRVRRVLRRCRVRRLRD